MAYWTSLDDLRAHVKLEDVMAWTTPLIEEVCVGMEVTAYESAEIEN